MEEALKLELLSPPISFLQAFKTFVHPETQGGQDKRTNGNLQPTFYPLIFPPKFHPWTAQFAWLSLVHQASLSAIGRINSGQMPMKSLEWARGHLDRELWGARNPSVV